MFSSLQCQCGRPCAHRALRHAIHQFISAVASPPGGLVDFYDGGDHVHIWDLKFKKDEHIWGLRFRGPKKYLGSKTDGKLTYLGSEILRAKK